VISRRYCGNSFCATKNLHVSAGAKTLARATQQDGSHALIRFTARGRRQQLLCHLQIERIAGLRTVERHVGNIVANFEKDGIISHVQLRSSPSVVEVTSGHFIRLNIDTQARILKAL
jgi:hypothetical protein